MSQRESWNSSAGAEKVARRDKARRQNIDQQDIATRALARATFWQLVPIEYR